MDTECLLVKYFYCNLKTKTKKTKHFLTDQHSRSGPILSWRLIMKCFFYGHSPPSADSFKKGCCQLQAKVCARITG